MARLNIYADVTLLATGGYGASVALRPADQMGTLFYGASASTGDGIIMAEEVGADDPLYAVPQELSAGH